MTIVSDTGASNWSTQSEHNSLMGMDFDEDGRIYVVDAADDRVMRISPL